MARKNTQNYSRPIDFRLRLTEDAHTWLKKRAESHYRSITSEINLCIDIARQQIEGNKKADCTVESNQSASETAI